MRSVRFLVPPTLALTMVTVVHTAASWAHDPPGKHPLDNNGNAGGASSSGTASGGGGGGGGDGGAGGAGTGGGPRTADCGGVQVVDGKLVEIGAGCC